MRVTINRNRHIDLLAAVSAKLARNETRYPASLVRGSARKYTEY